jgi:hypothetical protein
MKIALVGSREFKDTQLIRDIVIGYFSNSIEPHHFISGGARGVDSIAEKEFDRWNEYEHEGKLKKTIFLPDWDKYGKRAGFIRNELIIKAADKVVAFWDGASHGTKHSIDLAIKAGKPVDIYVRP